MKRKKWLKLISTVSIDLLVAGVMVEAVLRLFPSVISAALLVHFSPQMRAQVAAERFPTADEAVPFVRDDGGFPFSIWKPFAEINYSFRDVGTVNTVAMDEVGFCNSPPTYTQQKSFDVVALGDSFVWCTTVRPEDTWVAQLAQQSGVSTYNLGAPSIGLYEYLQLLKQFGLPKHPKVVILSVYEGNDLRDASKYQIYKATGQLEDGPLPASSEMAVSPIWQSVPLLGRRSYFWNSLGVIATQIQLRSKVALPSKVTNTQTDNQTNNQTGDDENFRYQLNFEAGSVAFNLENGDRDEIAYANKLVNREVSLAVFDDAIAQFIQLAKANNFQPIVTYTPSAYTAYAEAVTFEQAGLDATMSAYSQQQRDFLAQQATALGYEFIDLTPVLQAAATDYSTPEKLLYYPTNRHLTRYGHAVVAESLKGSIKAAVQRSPP